MATKMAAKNMIWSKKSNKVLFKANVSQSIVSPKMHWYGIKTQYHNLSQMEGLLKLWPNHEILNFDVSMLYNDQNGHLNGGKTALFSIKCIERKF